MRTYLVCFTFFFLLLSSCNSSNIEEIKNAAKNIEKNPKKAVNSLKHLLTKRENVSQIHYLLFFTYLKNKHYEKALTHIQKCLEISPHFSLVVGDIKAANFLFGNSKSAQDPLFLLAHREIRKIIQDNQNSFISDKTQFHLAILYLLKNQKKQAFKTFHKVVTSLPKTHYDSLSLFFQAQIAFDYFQDEKTANNLIYQASNVAKEVGNHFEILFLTAERYNEIFKYEKNLYQAYMNLSNLLQKKKGFEYDQEIALRKAEEKYLLKKNFKVKAQESYKKLILLYPSNLNINKIRFKMASLQ